MKKLFYTIIVVLALGLMLLGCSSKTESPDNSAPPAASDTETPETAPKREITEEMAYEGVNNYCHSAYDWSVAEDNPSIMYVEMGEETESEYLVIFRSYTGSFVDFYVDKESGDTRMVERVPSLDIEEDAGSINLFDYLEQGA